jgi:hypothetical protein
LGSGFGVQGFGVLGAGCEVRFVAQGEGCGVRWRSSPPRHDHLHIGAGSGAVQEEDAAHQVPASLGCDG